MTPAGRWGERRKHLVPSLHLPPSKTCCILWYLSHITAEAWRDGGKHQEKVFIQQRGTAAPTVRSIGKMCLHTCCSHPRSKSKRNIANFLQLVLLDIMEDVASIKLHWIVQESPMAACTVGLALGSSPWEWNNSWPLWVLLSIWHVECWECTGIHTRAR